MTLRGVQRNRSRIREVNTNASLRLVRIVEVPGVFLFIISPDQKKWLRIEDTLVISRIDFGDGSLIMLIQQADDKIGSQRISSLTELDPVE